MDFTQELAHFFEAPPEKTKGKAPAGVCPNCWGYQEWDDRIREMREDRQIDVNNGLKHYAFIKEFVVEQVDGIRLRPIEEHSRECPSCKTVYVSRDHNLSHD